MPASILDLPTELILEIIHSDNSTDATTIACLGMTCRSLHDICQVLVLERQLPVLRRASASIGCLRIYKNSGSIAMEDEGLDDVKKIFQASFHKIEYVPAAFIVEEIAGVHGLIFHANAVGHIALHLDLLPRMSGHKDWYKPLASLIRISWEKMASLSVSGSPQSTFPPIPKTYFSNFGRLKDHFFGHKMRSGGIGTLPNRQAGAPEREIPNTGIYFGTPRELKSFEIHSPLLFNETCFPHTLRVLNGGYLTKLSLWHTRLRISDWSNILPLLSMPLLSEFNVRDSNIKFRDLSAFLRRHSSITHLDISCSIPLGPIMPPKGFLPHLEVISGNPDYLSRLLSSRRHLFPHLRSVALTHYPRRLRVKALDILLRNLADRKRGTIHLSIEFSDATGLTEWFSKAKSETWSLDCVETLEIIILGCRISSRMCDSFFSWVSDKFPKCMYDRESSDVGVPDWIDLRRHHLLVKSTRKAIVDPVLALFADLSDGEDEELTAEGKKEREEAREREREREKTREFKRRKIRAWGGLSLPSSSSRGGEEGGLLGVMWMMRVWMLGMGRLQAADSVRLQGLA
ncbi:uncharacterized protein LACBIDRAFT_324597 [Laccaria bicolor S238N-H82]|uniref:Predicted protein n=1 Tax=Laccaria bicolor (strain S238N-H82 / ATCC MYA-4686) TaxID=486041 RepID=B0D2F2_LACBS|nr:uncharacterized protein LACBIDRAFT_324597 [Laccaria bicolor S238N-H82]EDR11089.1 predicted protein [Laccaria bicolor S238N-H82]|eukprot:XP_001878390.1 predicted protein [Laccaria bicolor S238N-H82]